MRSARLRFLIGVLGVCALGAIVLAGYSRGQEPPFIPSRLSAGHLSIEKEAHQIPTYQLSSSSEEEVLFLTSAGGKGPHVAEYHLYGDGRLVREIVYNRSGRKPWKTDQVRLSSEDVELLFQLVVVSELPDLTEDRIRQKIGRRPLRMSDGSTVVLQLRFDEYQRPGDAKAAPFAPRVSMHAPGLQVRFFPQLGEAKALGTLRTALDDYFAQPAAEVIHGRKN